MMTGSGRACLATGMVVVVVVCEWPFGPTSTMAGPNPVLDSARRALPLGPSRALAPTQTGEGSALLHGTAWHGNGAHQLQAASHAGQTL
ncbi:hypothetical protein V8C44DRAFT_333177 [Trichoderma aethiopicum]